MKYKKKKPARVYQNHAVNLKHALNLSSKAETRADSNNKDKALRIRQSMRKSRPVKKKKLTLVWQNRAVNSRPALILWAAETRVENSRVGEHLIRLLNLNL